MGASSPPAEPAARWLERESTGRAGRGVVTPRPGANLHQPPEPIEAGVDTFKVSSYVADDRSIRALTLGRPTKRTAGGAVLVLGDDGAQEWPLPGARTLFYPSSALVAVEGHPSGARGVLAAPDDVPGWCEDVRDELRAHGVKVDDTLGVARCDAAVTLNTDPRTGRALLSGVAAIIPPRFKVETYRSAHSVETVYYVTERGQKRARWYDSATAYGTAEALTTIRAEDQRRYDRPKRRLDARTVTTENVRDAFRDRWGALAEATKGVTVGTFPVLIDKLGVMVESGELKQARAEMLAGHVVLSQSGLRPAMSRWSVNRRREQLREIGLVLADGELEPVEVHVAETIDAMCDSAVWA